MADWVFESWSPFNRVVETAAYFYSKPPMQQQQVTRESAVREAKTWLDAAGITEPEVRRSMIDNALEAEGMEPLAEDEGGDEGERP